ncbi:AAA family ATPase, partial [uncultured Dubosiella sp.]|uniref:AAA family ATPase n=1 Tax=uncultured Dubosiella sp. TaxID=1937011 RepID=UPI0026379710
MGTYVNPGNAAFREAINSKIYIDKTELIAYTNSVLNTKQKNICVSRPRRFGKSMAADMLAAYYSRGCNSAELFAGTKIEAEKSFSSHLNRHSVIRLDVQRFLEKERDLDTFIDEIEKKVISDLSREFPDFENFTADSRLKTLLEQIFAETGKGFIFVIDEWDCVFRMAKDQKEKQKEYLDFFRGLFKGAEYVDLAYMTGILPIKKYGEHSAINIFDEYSMISPKNLGEYFGFTEEEVREQCARHRVDYAEVEKWYDGYRLGELHIYNPKSVADVLMWKEFRSYWTGTETYEALKIYMDMNFDGLKEAVAMMLGNGCCRINTRKFQNDMTTFKTKDDVLTLLVHLGYLTYDKNTSEVFIPNLEITEEFMNAVDEPGWDGLIQSIGHSEELLQATWNRDENSVAEGIAAIHNETASMLKYNDENSLTCVILMAYYSAKAHYMNPIMELPTGKGFADVVYLPKRERNVPALVVELKWDRSAEGAIAQIKAKGYADWVKGYTGDILLVGINYDKETKGHQCRIEAMKY